MAGYDTNRLNISSLEQYCSSFNSEKTGYNNAYNTFNSSYLNSCSDSYVRNVSSKLKEKYNTIKNGYENINSWWINYNENSKALENKLSQSNNGGSIADSGLRGFIDGQLPVLDNYAVSFGSNYSEGVVTSSSAFDVNQISPELLAMFPFLATLPAEEATKFKTEIDSYNTFLTTVDGTINDLQKEYDYYHELQVEYQSMVNDSGINVDMPDLSYEENVQLKKVNGENLFNSFATNNSKNISLNDLDIKTQADLDAKVAALESDLNNAKSTKYYVKQLIQSLPYQYLNKCSDFKDKSNYDAYKDIDFTNKTLNGEYLNKDNINWLAMAKLSQADETFNSNFENNADIEWGKNCIPYYEKLQYLSDDEINKYNYLFSVSGNETAEKYLTSLQDTLNQRQGAKEAVDFLQYLNDQKNNNYLGDNGAVNKFLVTLREGMKDGTINFFEGVGNVVGADGVTSANQYKQMLIIQALSKKVSENDEEIIQLCKDYGVYEEVLGYTYKFGVTVGNMAPTIAASVIMNAAATPALGASLASSLGQWTGTALIGLSSAGNSYDYALSKGAEGYKAAIYGILNGASESLLEKYLGSIPGISESAQLGIKAMFKEGGQEVVQTTIGTILKKTMLGEEIDINEFGGEITESFLMGTLMSGMMNGGQVAIKYAGQSVVVSTDKLIKFINEHNPKGLNDYIAKEIEITSKVIDVDVTPSKSFEELGFMNFGEILKSLDLPEQIINRLFPSGIDLTALKENLQKHFVNFYGEKHRETIRQRLSNLQFVFYDSIDNVKMTMHNLYQNKRYELTIKFLEKNGISVPFEVQQELFKSGKESAIDAIPGAKELLKLYFSDKAYTDSSKSSYGVFRDLFMNPDIVETQFIIGEKVEFLRRLGADVTRENISEFLKSEQGKQFLTTISKQQEIIGQLDAEFDSFSNQLKIVNDAVAKGTEIEKNITNSNMFQFLNKIKEFLCSEDRAEIDRLYQEKNLNDFSFIRNLKGYGAVFKYLKFSSPIEAFSSNSNNVLLSPEASEYSKKIIIDERIEYFKNIGLKVDGMSYEEIISTIPQNLIPNAELADKIAGIRKEFNLNAEDNFLSETSTYKYNVDFVDSLKLFDKPEFGVDIFKGGTQFFSAGVKLNDNIPEMVPLIFFSPTKSSFQYSDVMFIHEVLHAVNSYLLGFNNLKSQLKTGFEVIDENLDRAERRKYEQFNEITNQLMAMEITEMMHNDGFYIFNSPNEAKIKNGVSYEKNRFYAIDFYNKYKKDIIDGSIGSDLTPLFDIVGKENFDDLNQIIKEYNEIPYMSLVSDFSQKLDTPLTRKRLELIERLNVTLNNMDLYSKQFSNEVTG